MEIRDYQTQDREACLAIFQSNIPKFFRDEELAGFKEYLERYTSTDCWVVAHGSQVIACGGTGVRDDGTGRLRYGMVHLAWHRKGIGSMLSYFRMARLIENSLVKAIALETSQYNPKFYHRFGFLEISNQKNGFAEGLDLREMGMDLPSDPAQREVLRYRMLLHMSKNLWA